MTRANTITKRHTPSGTSLPRRTLLGVITLLLALHPPAVSAQLYVSSSGSDLNDGRSTSRPMATLQKAASLARAGDTVTVLGGVYRESVRLSNSGSPGRPIVFRRFGLSECIITGKGKVGFTATGISDVQIDGFFFEDLDRAVQLERCSRITLRNCRILGATSYHAVKLEGSSYCTIEDNLVDKRYLPGDGITLNPIYAEGRGSSFNIISRNLVMRCGHVGIAQRKYGRQNVYRDNLMILNHTGMSIQEGPSTVLPALVEGNLAYWNGVISYSYSENGETRDSLGNGHAAQFLGGTGIIVRDNVFYDDTAAIGSQGNPDDPRFRQWRDLVTVGAFEGTDMVGTRFYNNTLIGATTQDAFDKTILLIDDIYAGRRCRSSFVVNNILSESSAPYQIVDKSLFAGLTAIDNVYDGNLIWSGTDQEARVRYYSTTSSPSWALGTAMAQKPLQWRASNRDLPPALQGPSATGPDRNVTPQATSPALNASVPLAITTSTGSGSTTLTVDDAAWFMDGWGIVTGDSLMIGSQPPVGVKTITLASHAITLTAPRSWSQGTGVWHFRSDRWGASRIDIGGRERLPDTTPSSIDLPRKGDLNDDGRVDLHDEQMLRHHLDGRTPLTISALARADAAPGIMGDRQIDALDLFALRFLALFGAWPGQGGLPRPSEGWNLVSLAGRPPSSAVESAFPGGIGPVYVFDNSTRRYAPSEQVQHGLGYWGWFPKTERPAPWSGATPSSTVTVTSPGYALLGSLSYPIAVSDLQTTPEGAVYGQAYRFDPDRQAYVSTDTLYPGEGTWVLINEACQIHLTPIKAEDRKY